MINRNGPRPGFFFFIQLAEKLSSVVHIGMRIEHVLHGQKFPVVPIVINLHTPHVDQLFAIGIGVLKSPYRFSEISRIDACALNVHGIRV